MICDMPRTEYDALARVNFSTLKHIARSPLHYRHALGGGGPDTDARKRGRATHLAVFEPPKYEAEVVVWRGGRRAGKDWEAFAAEHMGREILTVDEDAQCQRIAAAVRTHVLVGPMLRSGRAEVTVLWNAEPEGQYGGLDGRNPKISTPAKARVDFLCDLCGPDEQPPIIDLKTTKDASPEGFGRECVRYGSVVQAAWYVDAVAQAESRPPRPYLLVAVEPEPPFAVGMYEVGEELLDIGRAEYGDWLRTRAACVKAGKWPGYTEGVMQPLVMPRWWSTQEEES